MEFTRIFLSLPFRFNLLLLPVVFTALAGKSEYLYLALAGGFMLDIYGATPFGVYALGLTMTGLLINFASRVLDIGGEGVSLKIFIVTVFLASLVTETLVRLAGSLLPAAGLWDIKMIFAAFSPRVFYASFALLIWAGPVFWLWQRLEAAINKLNKTERNKIIV